MPDSVGSDRHKRQRGPASFSTLAPSARDPKGRLAIAHYQIRIVWKVLHDGVRYRSPDTEVIAQRAVLTRAKRAINELRKLGYAVSVTPPSTEASATTS